MSLEGRSRLRMASTKMRNDFYCDHFTRAPTMGIHSLGKLIFCGFPNQKIEFKANLRSLKGIQITVNFEEVVNQNNLVLIHLILIVIVSAIFLS